MKQRGIISYGISPNRQNPLAGTAHDAIFNTFRRFSSQFLYWAPSLVAGYYIVHWAVERYVTISSPPPATAPRDFDHKVAKEGPTPFGKEVQYSNRGFCRLGTSTSTRRQVVLSSAARRSKRWTSLRRYYLGALERGCSSRQTGIVLNRLTCISPSLSLHGSNRSRHRQDMDLFWGIGCVGLGRPTSSSFMLDSNRSHVIQPCNARHPEVLSICLLLAPEAFHRAFLSEGQQLIHPSYHPVRGDA